ncbi:cation diffusion facilitator family transporter [Tumidithrix helvetica PCC 7403]|uniref:cation diffusion facilitator family transporter n=1 Tax=Tumidithrix helvetica TaxID=3457545 RepID=UPI003CBA907B
MFHHHSLNCSHCSDVDLGGNAKAASHKVRLLWTVLILVSSFSIAELWVGLSSHSLSLLADSGHMLSDGLTLGLALMATWIAQRPANQKAPFGYRRVEVLAALVNALGVEILAGWLAWEAVMRLQTPPDDILSLPMLITAIAGLGINSLNAWLLHKDSHDDLNLKGAFLHVVSDAISSVGVILAATAVWKLQWNWADGAIGLGVAILIGLGSIPLIRQSLGILLERAPGYLDIEAIQAHLESFDGVAAVANLRVWSIALQQEALLAELKVFTQDGRERDRLLAQIQASLKQTYGIQEVFLQITAVDAIASSTALEKSQSKSLEKSFALAELESFRQAVLQEAAIVQEGINQG